MQDFSQNKEQAVILDYFQSPRFEYLVGRFLDVGANDGSVLSNTRALALLSWRGVCVEPAPIAFAKLAALYADRPGDRITDGITCVNAAITLQDAPIAFYDSGTHLKKGDTSLLSTTRPEEMARWKKSGEVFTKTTVRGITIATLLKETGMTHADFISIDCEGVDLEVLTQLDLAALGTRMVCVEVNRADQRPFDAHCVKHGLRLHHRNYENAIYVK